MQLKNYLIDVSKAVLVPEPGGGLHSQIAQVQLVTYGVLAESANEAMRRFTEEQAGVVVYEGPLVDFSVVGIQELNVGL